MKIKHMEKVLLDGVEFTIHTMEEMKYDGNWDVTGFNVYWIDAGLFGGPHRFIGYPTNSDLKSLINQNK